MLYTLESIVSVLTSGSTRSVFWIGSPHFRLALCRVSSSILFATRTTNMPRSRMQIRQSGLPEARSRNVSPYAPGRRNRLWTARKPIFPGPVAVVSRFPGRGNRVAARVNVVQAILQGLWGVRHENCLWYMRRSISAARSFGGQGRARMIMWWCDKRYARAVG
jgi:hypothetical protein